MVWMVGWGSTDAGGGGKPRARVDFAILGCPVLFVWPACFTFCVLVQGPHCILFQGSLYFVSRLADTQPIATDPYPGGPKSTVNVAS